MNQPLVDGTELTCREIIDFLREYLDGELPPRERAIFVAHLKICAACRDYLDSYRTTIQLTQQLSTIDPLPASDVPEDLILAILAARKNT